MNGLRTAEINMVMLSGRLVRDPEKVGVDKGFKLCKFSIAVNRRYKAANGEWKDDTSFINISVWGDAAARLMERLKKGYAVVVEGRLKSSSWEDKENKKHTGIEVVANRVQVLTKAEGAQSAAEPENAPAEAVETGTPTGDEEIPF
jgi:single-strand DNA-binding protein